MLGSELGVEDSESLIQLLSGPRLVGSKQGLPEALASHGDVPARSRKAAENGRGLPQ